MSAALTPWRKPRAVHDPGKILLDVALAVALGRGCLADIGMLRAEPDVRPGGLRAHSLPCHRQTRRIRPESPRGDAGRTFPSTGRVWELAGASIPATDGQVIVDMGGVLPLAHSEKQDTTAPRKKTFGHRPLVAFADHGQAGSGEPVAALLRPGNAGSNTAADHIETARLALAQLSRLCGWGGRHWSAPTPAAASTPDGQWLSYSVGMTITDGIHQAVLKIPKKAWTPALIRRRHRATRRLGRGNHRYARPGHLAQGDEAGRPGGATSPPEEPHPTRTASPSAN
ncbi:transposase [Streptomyces sp. NPDC028722]|uniref:transposase n=1 Tax=Streptomyces sp. NPDC028722 TaxID=3155016 RepID=UPI003403CE79